MLTQIKYCLSDCNNAGKASKGKSKLLFPCLPPLLSHPLPLSLLLHKLSFTLYFCAYFHATSLFLQLNPVPLSHFPGLFLYNPFHKTSNNSTRFTGNTYKQSKGGVRTGNIIPEHLVNISNNEMTHQHPSPGCLFAFMDGTSCSCSPAPTVGIATCWTTLGMIHTHCSLPG